MIEITMVYTHLNATRIVLRHVADGVPAAQACQSPAFLEPFYGLFDVDQAATGSHLWADDPANILYQMENILSRGLYDLTQVGTTESSDEVMTRIETAITAQFVALAPHIMPALEWYHQIRPALLAHIIDIPERDIKALADLIDHVDRSLPQGEFVEVLEELTRELRQHHPDELQQQVHELGSPLLVLHDHLGRILLRRQLDGLDLDDDHARELFIEHGHLPADRTGDDA